MRFFGPTLTPVTKRFFGDKHAAEQLIGIGRKHHGEMVDRNVNNLPNINMQVVTESGVVYRVSRVYSIDEIWIYVPPGLGLGFYRSIIRVIGFVVVVKSDETSVNNTTTTLKKMACIQPDGVQFSIEPVNGPDTAGYELSDYDGFPDFDGLKIFPDKDDPELSWAYYAGFNTDISVSERQLFAVVDADTTSFTNPEGIVWDEGDWTRAVLWSVEVTHSVPTEYTDIDPRYARDDDVFITEKDGFYSDTPSPNGNLRGIDFAEDAGTWRDPFTESDIIRWSAVVNPFLRVYKAHLHNVYLELEGENALENSGNNYAGELLFINPDNIFIGSGYYTVDTDGISDVLVTSEGNAGATYHSYIVADPRFNEYRRDDNHINYFNDLYTSESSSWSVSPSNLDWSWVTTNAAPGHLHYEYTDQAGLPYSNQQDLSKSKDGEVDELTKTSPVPSFKWQIGSTVPTGLYEINFRAFDTFGQETIDIEVFLLYDRVEISEQGRNFQSGIIKLEDQIEVDTETGLTNDYFTILVGEIEGSASAASALNKLTL